MSSYKFKNKTNDFIVTDSGFEVLSYQDASKFFSEKEIFDYWQKEIEYLEVDEIALKLGVSLSNYDIDTIEYENIINEIYNKNPIHITVVVAKAIYKEHKWISVISLPTFEADFSEQESKSIRLGLLLQKELGKKIEIINDCKSAVLKLRSELALSSILWTRRNNTKKAHNLKMEQANRIINKTKLIIS